MKKTNYIFLFSLLFLFMFYPIDSFAAWNDIFRPEAADTDLLVKYVIEPIGNNDVQTNPIARVSSVFLLGVIALAGVLFIYNFITSTANTAIQGEMMGKKGALSYTTARNVVGIGMLIPLGTSAGYSAIQKIILYLAIQGVYLADFAWEKYIDDQPLKSQVILNGALRAKVLNDLKPIALFAVCANHFNLEPGYGTVSGLHSKTLKTNWGPFFKQIESQTIRGYSQNNTSQLDEKQRLADIEMNKLITELSFGYNKDGRRDNRNICGKIEITTQQIKNANRSFYTEISSDSSTDTNALNERMKKAYSASNVAKVANLDDVKDEVEKAHLQIIKGIVGDNGKISPSLQKLVNALIKKEDTETVSEIAKIMGEIAEGYHKEIKKVAVQHVDKLTKQTTEGRLIQDAMKKDGIAAAGAWYWAVVSQGSNLSDIINSPPVITNITDPMNTKDGNVVSMQQKYLNSTSIYPTDEEQNKASNNSGSSDANKTVIQNATNLGRALTTAKNRLDLAVALLLPENNFIHEGRSANNGAYTSTKSSIELMKRITGSSASPLSQADFEYKGNTNPVITVTTLGKKVLWWIEGMFDKLLTNEANKDDPTAKAQNTGIMFLGLPVMLSLLLPAIIMAYYIPLLPLILWIGILIGWITMVIQGLFGAPLWMLAHLTPDKESFVGRQGQGYMLVLGMFIRPILMVIGFIVSIQLLIPVGKIINAFFGFAAMTVMGGTGFIWLIGLLAVVFIYAMMLQNTVKKIYALMHVIPDSLLQWFGGQDQKVLGEYANGIEQGSQQGLNSMAGGLSSLGHGIMRGASAGRMGAMAAGAGGKGGHGAGGQDGGGVGISGMVSGLTSAMKDIKSSSGFKSTTALANSILGNEATMTENQKFDNGSSSWGQQVGNDMKQLQDDYNSFQNLPASQKQKLWDAQQKDPSITSYIDGKGNVRPIMPNPKSQGGGNEMAMELNGAVEQGGLNQLDFAQQSHLAESRRRLILGGTGEEGGGASALDLRSGRVINSSHFNEDRNGIFVGKRK